MKTELNNLKGDNESAFGNYENGIMPLLVPNKEIFRVSPDGETYYIKFTEEFIKEKYVKYLMLDNKEIRTWITRKDRLGIPKGSWVCKNKSYISMEMNNIEIEKLKINK